MQPIKRSLYIGASEDSVPHTSVRASLSSPHATKPVDSIAVKISNCLAQEVSSLSFRIIFQERKTFHFFEI